MLTFQYKRFSSGALSIICPKQLAVFVTSIAVFLLFTHAGTTLAYAQTTPATQVQEVHLQIPPNLLDHSAVITGTGQSDAVITIIGTKDQQVLFSLKTKVNSRGQWQVTLPAHTQPDQLVARSEVQVTPTQVIETVTVTSAAVTSSLVLLQLFADRFLRLLQFLGLVGRRKTKGFVFDLTTKKPIAFARLIIQSVVSAGTKATSLNETVVTTVDGFFKSVDLPTGTYKIQVVHPNFEFPVLVPRPWYLPMIEFYRGEEITLNKTKKLDFFLIPMQPKEKAGVQPLAWLNLHIISALFKQAVKIIVLPMAVISIVLVFFYPSFINFLISAFYLLIGVYEVTKELRLPTVAGEVVTTTGDPIAQAVIRIYETDLGIATVLLTNKQGKFTQHLPPQKYQITVNKDGFVSEAAQQSLGFEELNLMKSVTNLEYALTPATKVENAQ